MNCRIYLHCTGGADVESCQTLLYNKMYDRFTVEFKDIQIIIAKVRLFIYSFIYYFFFSFIYLFYWFFIIDLFVFLLFNLSFIHISFICRIH